MEEIFLKALNYFSNKPNKVFKFYSSPFEIQYKEREV